MTQIKAKDSKRYQADIVRSIYGDAYSSLIPSLALGYLILSFIFHDSPYLKEPMTKWWWISIVSFSINVIVAVSFIIKQKKGNIDYSKWAKHFDAICFITGLSHGYFFLLLTITQADTVLVYCSILLSCAIGSSITSGLRPLSNVCYFSPLFIMAGINFWHSNYFIEFISWSLLCILLSASFSFKGIKILKESFDLRDENLELVKKLERQKEIEIQANLDKSRFISAASHDLRQPLQSTNFLLAALGSKLSSTEQHTILAKTQLSLGALNAMLDSLMDISKIDGGTISIQPRCISLLSLIKDEVGLYRPLAQEKKLSLILKSAHDFEIVADPIMIRRVVSNLLDNALKYTQAGSITVSVSKADGYFNIEIVDTGVGISDHDQSLIFKEFFQVNNPERDRRKGVGLGLSIVQRLIDQLDGKITVNSDLGRGTSILVTLPELVNLTITNEHLDSKLVAFENLADHHILIIDDDIEVRESLELLLEGWGIITICAESIDEAMRKLKKSNTYIDSMIVDYRLRNNETGIEAIKKVRELLNDAQLPALIITGDTAADQLITLKQSGYTYLNKPINAQVLNTHLANMLANKIIAMDLA